MRSELNDPSLLRAVVARFRRLPRGRVWIDADDRGAQHHRSIGRFTIRQLSLKLGGQVRHEVMCTDKARLWRVERVCDAGRERWLHVSSLVTRQKTSGRHVRLDGRAVLVQGRQVRCI